jgi:hypothetical protein
VNGRLSLRRGNFERILREGTRSAKHEKREQQTQYVQAALWDKGFHQRPSMVLPCRTEFEHERCQPLASILQGGLTDETRQ